MNQERPRVLLLGRNGQVGWALAPRLALRYALIAPTRQELEVSDLSALSAFLDEAAPQAIVNAAAYTAVDRAESEPELAYRINAEAPRLLSEWAARHGAVLIHYSTDYVFDGQLDRFYRETDPVAPINVYGASKQAGEAGILASGARAVILRTSWVYGLHGQNFLKTMLRLARTREELRVVADQVGAPTSAELIAEVTELVLDRLLAHPSQMLPPLMHLAPRGAVSWHGYAQFLLEVAQAHGWPLALPVTAVIPIATSDWPTAARRPANSRLACDQLEAALSIELPPWQQDVARTVSVLVDLAR